MFEHNNGSALCDTLSAQGVTKRSRSPRWPLPQGGSSDHEQLERFFHVNDVTNVRKLEAALLRCFEVDVEFARPEPAAAGAEASRAAARDRGNLVRKGMLMMRDQVQKLLDAWAADTLELEVKNESAMEKVWRWAY